MATTRRRYPKGTWMRLHSKERLRAFVGPEPDKKISQRRLSRYVGVHESFINHLTSGRRSSCTPMVAQRIAEAVGVPLEILFVPEMTSSDSAVGKQEKVPA